MASRSGRFAMDPAIKERLNKWDNKYAPLSEKQVESYMTLMDQCSERPMPSELIPDEPSPFDRHSVALASGETANASSAEAHGIAMLDEPLQKLALDGQNMQTAQQFLSWFADVEAAMRQDEESEFREYLSELRRYTDHCDSILSDINTTMRELDRLKDQYCHVSTQTGALHSACEQLLEDQTRLVETVTIISDKLVYFDDFDSLHHKLHSPMLSVMSETFMPILTRLDECITYLSAHPQFQESSVYLTRFRQCQSYALSLIKVHTINTLREATKQVMPSPSALASISTEDMFGSFFGKFRTCAPRIKLLMEQVEEKAGSKEDYCSLLQDCQQCYFNFRLTLLQPSLAQAMRKLVVQHNTDKPSLVRAGGTFMVRLCQDEYQLYLRFFSSPCPGLDDYLESLSSVLYDELRPCFIQLNHLETLADLCLVLKVELIEDYVAQKPRELAAFGVVAEQMLEDVQQRLVYRAQSFMQSDIQRYAPGPGDLAYPEKLQMSKSSDSTTGASQVPAAGSPTAGLLTPGMQQQLAAADQQGMWYPTLRRTLVCLAKLYRCINKGVFESLSQEALAICVQSLVYASTEITKKKTQLNGLLFLIKHLLILREQIAPFDVNFAVKERGLDFSHLKDVAFGLFQHRSRLFALTYQNALLEFVVKSGPTLTENYLDSRKDVDNRLKSSCEQFVSTVSSQLSGPLRDYLEKAQRLLDLSAKQGSKIKLRQQPFADPGKVHQVVMANFKVLETQMPEILRLMNLYLANKELECILFKPVKEGVVSTYKQLSAIVLAHYSTEDQAIIACPGEEQITALIVMP
ncbi:conserved oligomeric Golgi complex subunit 3-like [Sycon ciliatum]|uniref:conserved oligomeric Golgi complex subunit 3-like n=1 Tax=Sycon ciliatum TaxID=27933 RepID=UPI0031F70725|eukprot:scpid29583/ scgid18824/ Conserved oligomeric Golgi complex subunit 3; Component of oligomeric Golgi complex 3